MKRALFALLSVVCLIASPALAQERQPLSLEEMDEARGGFIVDGLLTFGFGAVIKTYENGELALRTEVNWNLDGAHVDTLPGSGVTLISNDGIYQTAGGTQLMHDVMDGKLANLLMNTQSNVTIRQETDITLALPSFGAVQTNFAQDLQTLHIGQDLAASAIGALGN